MAKKTKKQGDTTVAIDEGVVTLAALCERYLKKLERRGAGPGTLASYAMELKVAQKELGEATPIGELTVERVAAYFASDAVMKTKAGVPKAPPTYLKTQRVLRQALYCAVELGYLAAAPLPEEAAKA